LLSVRAAVGETDGELERARAHADLRPDRRVAGSGAVVAVREFAVRVAEVDVDVRAAEVACGGTAEGADNADPDVLLLQEQRRRVRIDDAGEVAIRERLPVRGRLHVEPQAGQLGRRGRGDP